MCLPISPLGLANLLNAFKAPSENRRTRTFDPLLKRQMLYRLSYILNLKKVHEYRNLLILVSLALLVPVLTTHLFTLVYRHLMAFSLFSAGHIVSVFPLVLKADNIGSFFEHTNFLSAIRHSYI